MREHPTADMGANHAHAIKKKQEIVAQTSKNKSSIYHIQIRVHANPLYVPQEEQALNYC